jgi:hypothetical protein
MAYGTIKIDTITFTDGGIDKSVAISGLVQNPTFTGNVTVTGTISGNTVRGQTISGVTVTGTTANFTSGNFTNISGGTHTITSGVFASGTAANPSISFVSDPNTGLYSPGADQVAISTNGTGRLFVNSNGDIGLGTATPDVFGRFYARAIGLSSSGTTSIQINGATGNSAAIDLGVNAARTGSLESNANETTLGTLGATPLRLITNGSERARIDSSGRLGLGTSSPGNLLTVQSASNGTAPEVKIQNPVDSASSQTAANGLSGGRLLFGATGTYASAGRIEYRYDSSDASFGRNGRLFISTLSTATSALVDAVTIDAAQRVGIGVTSVSSLFQARGTSDAQNIIHIDNTAGTTDGSATNVVRFTLASNGGWANARYDASQQIFNVNGNEAARVDGSRRLLVGTSSSPSAGAGQYARIVVQGYTGANNEDGAISIQRGEVAANITSGENIGKISFNDSAGYAFADIAVQADANAGSNDYPGRLVFSTTADGASSPTERMRINSAGAVSFGTTSNSPAAQNVQGIAADGANGYFASSRDGNPCASFNRKINDGDIVDFRQDGVVEGTISVSGSTISYNGAHLSRWSQLPDSAERTEILRGTVLSNIDEMCAWGEEDNEQLNRMKVSDVEGDPNVSGVFQAWDDDDDTYTDDFYCAMTGDFIIRISAGIPVHRGQLLMSAGDGTAKPQDDDIVRSKTIAKVTSNHITCTYDDGSYCVPCVLMAC